MRSNLESDFGPSTCSAINSACNVHNVQRVSLPKKGIRSSLQKIDCMNVASVDTFIKWHPSPAIFLLISLSTHPSPYIPFPCTAPCFSLSVICNLPVLSGALQQAKDSYTDTCLRNCIGHGIMSIYTRFSSSTKGLCLFFFKPMPR